MLLLVVIPALSIVALAHRQLLAFAPSNMLISRVRASRPTFRAVAALEVLALLLVCVAHALSVWIGDGASGWLNTLVLVLLWDAVKCSSLAAHTTIRRFCLAAGHHLPPIGLARDQMRRAPLLPEVPNGADQPISNQTI